MRRKTYGWYRAPHTTQERRVTGKRNKFGRAKRNAANLVDSYEDRPHSYQKSWKATRRKQYREGGREQEHKIFLPEDGSPTWCFWVNTWELEEWFQDHDIPYRLRKIEQVETRVQRSYQRNVCSGRGYWETYVTRERPRKNGARKTKTQYVTRKRWRFIYEWRTITLDPPRKYRTAKLLGYELTWWYNKDIGIEKLLQRFSRPKSYI